MDKVLNKELSNLYTFQPRAILYIGDRDKETLTFSTGLYQQMDFRIFDEKVVNLKPQQAIHYNVGYEKKYEEWQARAEVFYKDYSNLTDKTYNNSGELLGYNNDQSGKAKGIEFFLQKKETGNYYGSLSYTFSEVSYKNDRYGSYAPDHDQRHTINLLAAYRASPEWTLITKAILHSGKPYTSIETAAYNDSLKQYLPILGQHNSSRFPTYASVDIMARYKKEKLFFKRYDGEVYVGLANIFNTRNVLSYEWNDDYSERESIFDVPRLPVFGMTIKF